MFFVITIMLTFSGGEQFTRDSIIGSVIWYINKNLEDILAGNQPDKTPNLSTQPTGYTIK